MYYLIQICIIKEYNLYINNTINTSDTRWKIVKNTY